MAIRTKIDPVEVVTEATLSAELALPEARRAAAAFAREGIEEAARTNQRILGRRPRHVNFVDGRRDAPLETVNPDGGQIITEFDLVTDVLRWIADALFEASPFRSGAYREGHTLYADGREVPVGETIPEADEYVFTNPVPYARKIEIGKTKTGRPFVIQVPNRIYERTAKAARSRFGNVMKISFTYRGIVGGAMGRSRAHNRPENRSPAIVLQYRG